MAIRFETSRPQALLDRLRKAVDDGAIATWSYDSDGDFTHTAAQWVKKAWLRPAVESEKLSFYIIAPKGVHISRSLYAVYHGRFIETALSHCDDAFRRAVASAYPEGRDMIKAL
jgi:hypothetical protein